MSNLSDQQLVVVAQAYGLKHWLSTPLNGAKRMVLENFCGKYREHMESLREADKAIRIEVEHFTLDLMEAKRAYRDRRYIDVAHWIGQINLGSHKIQEHIKSVVDVRADNLQEYFGQSDDAEIDAN